VQDPPPFPSKMSPRALRLAATTAALAALATLTACTARLTAPTPVGPDVAKSATSGSGAFGSATAPIPAATLAAVPCADLAGPGPTPPAAPPAVVAVVGGGNLWLWRDGQKSAQRVALGDAVEAWPSWNGPWVAVLREAPATDGGASGYGPQSLWALRADGTNLHEVVSSAALEADLAETGGQLASPYQVQWIPGTNALTYRVAPSVTDKIEGPGPARVRAVDVARGRLDWLPFRVGDGLIEWSPGGQWAALGFDDGVGLASSDYGDTNTAPPIGMGIGLGHGTYKLRPAWSAGGGRFAVAAPQGDPLAGKPEEDDTPFDLWEYDVPDAFLAGSPRRLGRITADFRLDPQFAPDLSMVAYYRRPATEGTANREDLHIDAVDGAWSARIPNAAFVAWSPDNRHFLYRLGEPDALFVGRLCGPAVQVAGSPDSHLAGTALWLDPERYVFLDTDKKDEHGAWRLRLGRRDGSSQGLASLQSEDTPRLAANRR
jgi:hypothetical protein